jgi:dienelactone hydrolase
MKKLILLYLVFCSSALWAQEPTNTASFVKQFTSEKFRKSRKMLSGDMKKKMSTTKIKGLWTMLEKQFGDFNTTTYQNTFNKEELSISNYLFKTEKASFTLEVAENQKGEISGFYIKPMSYSMPDYAANAKFGKENITITTGEFNLPGEIILPLGVKNPPLVILVHGSGPHDRDETIGPNKVFYDLALGLAAKGVATLRYEKRSKVYDSLFKYHPFSLKEETIDDAITAVNLAKQSTLIDTSRIFVLGHSLGAMAAPYINNNSNCAGAIMFSGPFRSLTEIMPQQIEYLAGLDGKISKAEKKTIKQFKERAIMIRADMYDSTTSYNDLMGYWPGYFWKTEQSYLPPAHIEKGTKPLLILHGSRDYQIDPIKDFVPLRNLCDKKTNCQAIMYEGLNHLFIMGEGQPNPSEYFIPGNVDERVISDIAVWVKNQNP